MVPKKTIPSFFIFLLIIPYLSGDIDLSSFIVLMFVFWSSAISFDLYTTFKNKELIKYESNPIISCLLKKTTVKKSIIVFIIFQIIILMVPPTIVLLQFDLVLSGIIAMFMGYNHVIAGLSNRKFISEFHSKKISS